MYKDLKRTLSRAQRFIWIRSRWYCRRRMLSSLYKVVHILENVNHNGKFSVFFVI